MKVFNTLVKIAVALAAVAGAIYVAATYGDKIVAWAKKFLSAVPCNCDCDGECTCDCTDEPVAEEAAEKVEEAPAEEAAEEAVEEAAEEVITTETEFVADEADFQ